MAKRTQSQIVKTIVAVALVGAAAVNTITLARADYPVRDQVADRMQWMFSCSDDPCTINYGAGGRTVDFENAFRDFVNHDHTRVRLGFRVTGECNSACIWFIEQVYRRNPAHVCVGPGVSMMFHRLLTVYNYNQVVNDALTPQDTTAHALPRRPLTQHGDPTGLRPALMQFARTHGTGLQNRYTSWGDVPTATYEDARRWYRTCAQ